jgi:peptidoglycan/LPS O-acetylase OafA/YrhL
VSVDPRLVPPTWALTVEIFFYALICAGISKSLPRVVCWLALSVLYVVATVALGWPERDRYFPAAAASLPFSMGALVFFATRSQRIRDRWQRLGLRLPLLAGLMIGNLAVWMLVSKTGARAWTEVGQYINVALCSLVVYALAVSPRPAAISAQLDQRIGDFSYPIYLLHWQCGLVASMLLFGGATPPMPLNGLAVLLLASVFVAGLSMLFIRHVDPALQALRGRVRPAGRQGAGV